MFKNNIAAWVVLLTVCFSTIVFADENIIVDSFKRPDSNVVGKTECGRYQWLEVGDNENGDLIRISGEKLSLHYFKSTPHNPVLACNLADLRVKNLDLSITLRPYGGNYGFCSGISYRMPAVDGVFRSPGYHVVVNSKDTPNTVSLKFGQHIEIATAEVKITKPTNLRVLVEGDSHKVYVNDELVISVNDETSLEAGYVGVFAWYDIPSFRDFQLKILP